MNNPPEIQLATSMFDQIRRDLEELKEMCNNWVPEEEQED